MNGDTGGLFFTEFVCCWGLGSRTLPGLSRVTHENECLLIGELGWLYRVVGPGSVLLVGHRLFLFCCCSSFGFKVVAKFSISAGLKLGDHCNRTSDVEVGRDFL